MKLPLFLLSCLTIAAAAAPPGKTAVSIAGADFHINGQPTYAGRSWQGHRVEGLLMNSRMVQGVFDDLNPETAPRWAYPDTGKWDAERNVSEFIAALPQWRKHGLLAVTVNFQGGSPEGYSKTQTWETGAFLEDGGLRPADPFLPPSHDPRSRSHRRPPEANSYQKASAGRLSAGCGAVPPISSTCGAS